MKKTMVRIVAALLVAMLALTLLPMGAFAKEAKETINVYQFYTDDSKPVYDSDGDPKNGSFIGFAPIIEIGAENKVLNTSGYAKHYIDPTTGEIYDLDQFYLLSSNNGKVTTTAMGQSFTISGVPTDPAELEKWQYKYLLIDLWYVAHQHNLSRWYSDGTTHWKECLTCKKYHVSGRDKFMYQNWCQDGDEDGICNVCGGDVPYHDVTVVEEEGGKIIVNRDNACHRMKITADVEPAEGYKLKKLHFTKIRDNGSEQEITRYKKNGQFWTYMPTYDLEVSAEFVKVKTKK